MSHASSMERYAKLLTHYCAGVKPGQRVLVQGPATAEELIREIETEIWIAGGQPIVYMAQRYRKGRMYAYASPEVLVRVDPILRMACEEFDAMIQIDAPENVKERGKATPQQMQAIQKANAVLSQTYMRRLANKTLHPVSALYPTAALAQKANMSTEDFAQLVFATCVPDKWENPVEYWDLLTAQMTKAKNWLTGKKTVRIKTPAGTDLSFDMSSSNIWVVDDGKINNPGGEVFGTPQRKGENSANGIAMFDVPMVLMGFDISDVTIEFKDGVAVNWTAKVGQTYLDTLMDTDDGVKTFGEFGIGFNEGQPCGHILFDEKLKGTVHLAVGFGLTDAGGDEEASAEHTDLIMKTQPGSVTVDGISIVKPDGTFVWDELMQA